MSSSKKEETAMATEQLGSMSLGESAERKENENEPTAKNGTNPTTKKMCSACGEKSGTLKKCNGCLCVWYCDKKCQNKHRKEHKKECRRIKVVLDKRGGKLNLGTEKDLGPLPDLLPRKECPICMRVFPIRDDLRTINGCCGKTVCRGCHFQHQMQSEKRAAESGQKPGPSTSTCAFCREPIPHTDEEVLMLTRKRVERKDPRSMFSMAMNYANGWLGLSVDQSKCIELLRQSADLGCSVAHYQLATYHRKGEMGLEHDEEEVSKYLEKAAEGGHIKSQNMLGYREGGHGNHVAAMRHFRFAASAGYKPSMDMLIKYFERGDLHHRDLSQTLQNHYHARAEMKSKERDIIVEYLNDC